jgi:hypothetical protein
MIATAYAPRWGPPYSGLCDLGTAQHGARCLPKDWGVRTRLTLRIIYDTDPVANEDE